MPPQPDAQRNYERIHVEKQTKYIYVCVYTYIYISFVRSLRSSRSINTGSRTVHWFWKINIKKEKLKKKNCFFLGETHGINGRVSR